MKLTHNVLASLCFSLSIAAGFAWNWHKAVSIVNRSSIELTMLHQKLDQSNTTIAELQEQSDRYQNDLKNIAEVVDEYHNEVSRLSQELDGEREVRIAAQADLAEVRARSIAWTPAVAAVAHRGARK